MELTWLQDRRFSSRETLTDQMASPKRLRDVITNSDFNEQSEMLHKYSNY